MVNIHANNLAVVANEEDMKSESAKADPVLAEVQPKAEVALAAKRDDASNHGNASICDGAPIISFNTASKGAADVSFGTASKSAANVSFGVASASAAAVSFGAMSKSSKKPASAKLGTHEAFRAAAKADNTAGALQIDKSLADKVAWALIFDGGSRASKWVSEMIPEINSSAEAESYLAYLEDRGALIDTEGECYKAIVDFETYMGLSFNDAEHELKMERHYETLLSALVDYGEYATLDELLTSVEGLPARDEVRILLLSGVEKGDLEQDGRGLGFRSAMDGERAAAWCKDAAKREEEREAKEKNLPARRKAAKAGGSEYEAAMGQYQKWVTAKKAADAAAAAVAFEKRKAVNQAEIGLIVEKLETYKLGNGFVSAKWVKDAVEGIETVERAQELLDSAWKSGLVRRALKDESWIYAKLLSDKEWEGKRAELCKKFADDLAIRENEAKSAFEKKAAKRRKSAEDALANAESDEFASRQELAQALEDVKAKECELAEAGAKVQKIDEEIAAKESAISSLEAELDASGLFSFGKKSDLKQKIGAAQADASKLRTDKRMAETEIPAAQGRLDAAKVRANTLQTRVSQSESKVSTCEKNLANLEVELAKGPGPVVLAPADLIAKAVEAAQAWSAPVSAQWIAENIDDIDSAAEAKRLLTSAQGKSVFSVYASGLYFPTENISADGTSSDGSNKAVANAKLKVGRKVKFGRGFIGGERAEALRWRILDVDSAKGEVLLLCDYLFADMPFNEGEKTGTWANCSVAKWLMGVFAPMMFNTAELESIVERENLGAVFLLSADEFTKYKKKPGIVPADTSYYWEEKKWWLRTSADDVNTRAMYVTEKNGLSRKGSRVDSQFGYGVRPAVWVTVAAFEKKIVK